MTSDGIPALRVAPPGRVYLVLLAGLMAVSLGAIFARLAQDAGLPSLLIAAGRLTISALLLTPFVLIRHRAPLRELGRRDLTLAAGAGLFLALHFATWIASLEYTSVLISVVLVSTGPLWVALLEVVFLHARLNRLIVVGLGVAFAGGLGIAAAGSGGAEGSNPALGAVLSLIGAITFACYLVTGRKLRGKLPLWPYVWLVYSCAAIFLIALVLVTGTLVTGFPPEGYFWVLLMALFPQLIGHTSFNFALRYLPATYVGIAGQLEPIGSGLVAMIAFGEVPTLGQLAGSALIVTGVLLATLGLSRRRGG
jgi:drug/metabolite transporter (DMT)-like permease